MECSFEDLITQQYPQNYKPVVESFLDYLTRNCTVIVDELVETVKENATEIVKETIEHIASLHPVSHTDKITKFTKFADFIHKATADTKAGDVLEACSKLWDEFHSDCNPLSDIANDSDDVPKMLKRCEDAIKQAIQDMVDKNYYLQGSVIAVQYALLFYLVAQSWRGDKCIKQAQEKLKQIQKKYIIPAMNLMYVQVEIEGPGNEHNDEQKYQPNEPKIVLKTDISQSDREKVDLYFECASDRLNDSMEVLQDHKQAAVINAGIGLVSAAISGWFTHGLFSATKSLYGSNATSNTNLFRQQAAFTGLSGSAAIGLGWMGCKHLWNAQQITDILDKMCEMKRKIVKEREKLNVLIDICVFQRER